MPTLNWIGKEKVVNHHLDVPFKVLEHKYGFSNGKQSKQETKSGNMIIHGDNLEALKSLLPQYEGKVDCIYIDPPYNTGNEGWIYNDNVSDPKIKKWLGETVGKEGEDLTRHDKWLCMMYPRLRLLHKLLAEDGVIFISIDDNEQANLKLMLDELFGETNQLGTFIWKNKAGGGDDSNNIAIEHEYIVCYSKVVSKTKLNKIAHESPSMTAKYNRSEDGRRYYLERLDKTSLTYSASMDYEIECPDGVKIKPPQPNPEKPRTIWRWSRTTVEERRNELIFEKDKKLQEWRVYTKTWEPLGGVTPRSLLVESEHGRNRDGTQELTQIFSVKSFPNPKPSKLIQLILGIGTKEDSIVLDSFAGSGTTGHAVLNLNKEDGGQRKFILVEMDDEYAETTTAERNKRVIDGYGEGSGKVEGTGGAFDFYDVGDPLFTPANELNEKIGIEKIREYIWYTETQSLFEDEKRPNPYYLGTHNDTEYYFYYEKDSATTLNYDFLASLTKSAEGFIIYADQCTLPEAYMKKHSIIFKKIPRDITKF